MKNLALAILLLLGLGASALAQNAQPPINKYYGIAPSGAGGGGGAVSSVFGRTGAVTAQSGDYSSYYCALGGCTYTGPIVVPLGAGNATSIQAAGNPGTGLYFWNSNNFSLCQNSNCRITSNGPTLEIFSAELLGGYGGTSCGTLSNGYGCISETTTNGLVLSGYGASGFDVTLEDNAGSAALQIPTGTTGLVFNASTAHAAVIGEGTSAVTYTAGGATCFLYWTASTSDPTCHALVAGDIPSLSGTYCALSGCSLTGTLNLTNTGLSQNLVDTAVHTATANTTAFISGIDELQVGFSATTATQSSNVIGVQNSLYIAATNTQNHTGLDIGAYNRAFAVAGAAGTITEAIGSYNNCGNNGTTVFTVCVGAYATAANTGAGSSGKLFGIDVDSPTGGTTCNVGIGFGLTCPSGTTTYSIYDGTSAPWALTGALGAGSLKTSGTTAPSLANGNAVVYGSTSNGGLFGGQGSTNDTCLVNNGGTPAVCVPTGTTNATVAGTLTVNGTQVTPSGKSNIMGGNGASTVGSNATQYVCVSGVCGNSGTEANVAELSIPGTFKNLYVSNLNPSGTGTVVFTFRSASAGTSITCTITVGTNTSCNDLTHTASVTGGTVVDIQVVTASGVTSSGTLRWAIEFDPT